MKSPIAKLAIAAVIAALGVALAVYADADDSPGGVLLGILLVIGAVVFGVRATQRRG
jgi:drug/metabolite transporter (DMT)-like permease